MSDERLTDISTIWTTISSAHTPGPQSQAAMEELVGRYHDAVTRYIHLKVRDKHLADEVLQEFWTKLLTGKLAGADRTKGRFRDYLRTVLHRLIIDHFRTRKLQSLPPGDLLDTSRPDEDFDRVWREAVINRVWSRLETYQATTPKNRYATVLQLRRDYPQGVDRGDRREARRDHPHPRPPRGVPQEPPAGPRQVHRAPDPGAARDHPLEQQRGHRGRDLRPRPRPSLPPLLLLVRLTEPVTPSGRDRDSRTSRDLG